MLIIRETLAHRKFVKENILKFDANTFLKHLLQGKELKNRMQDFPFFTHAHRDCYVRRQVKHWENNLVEVDKGT